MERQKRIQQFLALKKKGEPELRAMLEGFSAGTVGGKAELVSRLCSLGFAEQESLAPQAIALRTKDNEDATAFERRARDYILPQDENGNLVRSKVTRKNFDFVTRDGKSYTEQCPCVLVKTETLKLVLDREWLVPTQSQRELVAMLGFKPKLFTVHFIRKRSNDRYWTMLHAQPKPQPSEGEMKCLDSQ